MSVMMMMIMMVISEREKEIGVTKVPVTSFCPKQP